ncbi:hypothetical protein JCM10914A_03120 [Paenibacillus sp. JCM 10914]
MPVIFSVIILDVANVRGTTAATNKKIGKYNLAIMIWLDPPSDAASIGFIIFMMFTINSILEPSLAFITIKENIPKSTNGMIKLEINIDLAAFISSHSLFITSYIILFHPLFFDHRKISIL